jgi:hypothetical protein
MITAHTTIPPQHTDKPAAITRPGKQPSPHTIKDSEVGAKGDNTKNIQIKRQSRKDPVLSKRLEEMRTKYRNSLMKQRMVELVLTSSSTTMRSSLVERKSSGIWCFITGCDT